MYERPVLISADSDLADEALRVAAAASVEVDHTAEVPSRAQWRSAPLILLEAGLAVEVARAGLPQRSGIVALAAADPDDEQSGSCVRLGVERTLRLPDRDGTLVALFAEFGAPPTGDGRVLAVLSACGGAGASVFCAAVAQAGQRAGRRVIVADCDPCGPGMDMILGIDGGVGVHWADLAAPSGRLPADALHHALPRVSVGRGKLAVLCPDRHRPGPIDPRVAEVVIESGRGAGDLVVADLPRHADPVTDRVLELADLAVLVAPSDIRGCYAAVRILPRLREFGRPLGLVVRGPSQAGLGADDVAALLQLPLLARFGPERAVDRQLQAARPPGGDPRSPLGRAARAVLGRLVPA